MSGIAPRGPGSNLQTNNPFGTVNNINTLFGGGSAASANPFGQSSTTSPFGNAFTPQQAAPVASVGANITNPFASSTSSTTNNPFASPSTNNPFNSKPAATTPPTGNLFGSSLVPAAAPTLGGGGGLFGSLTASPSPPAIGAPAPQAAPTPVGTSLFGSGGGGGLFGPPKPATSLESPAFTFAGTSPAAASPSTPLNLSQSSLFGAPQQPSVSSVSSLPTSVREIERVQNKLEKKLLELTCEEISKLLTCERTMRDDANCKLMLSKPKWEPGHIPELPPPSPVAC